MTEQELYRVPPTLHPTGDALRTLALIFSTVLLGLVVTTAVPDSSWAELTSPAGNAQADWHGNVEASAARY